MTAALLVVAAAAVPVLLQDLAETPAAARGAQLDLGPPYPARAAIDRAVAWSRTRGGDPAVAVVSSDGAVRGLNLGKQYPAYSLSKVMLLVAYLREHPSVDVAMRGVRARMIQHSDNPAADLVFHEIGGASGLSTFARTAGMTGFSPGRSWLDCRVTARDQALFFFGLDRWVPPGERTFVRALLGGVTPRQCWGIPAAARPLGWTVYFKGGWSVGNTYMTQAALLELGGRRFAVAILTEGNPDWMQGFGTLKGVAGLLLGQRVDDAYLAQVL